MRKNTLEARYMCVGENFIDNVKIGYCGDVHSLQDWLIILFPGKNAIEYFAGDQAQTIIDYIYRYKGKRLEKIKK